MAKQFTVVATNKDLQQIEALLRWRADVDMLSEVATADLRGLEPLKALPIPPEEAGSCSLFCYLTPKVFPGRIFVRRLSDVKTDIDLKRSHVIEFWRPFFDGKIMRPGRLCYQNNLKEDENYPEGVKDFYRWADGVMSEIRGALVRNKERDFYIGPDAAEGLALGKFRIESNI